MDHSTLSRARGTGLCMLAALLFSLGCASIESPINSVKLAFRQPGEVLETFPEPVAAEYHCDKRPLPFFEVEQNELVPHRVVPGSEFNHRMVYVLCPANPTQVVSGELATRILFRGEPVFSEAIQHDLKPGRWRMDTFIPLPAGAEPGIYALQVGFQSEDGTFETLSTFAVEGPAGD